MKYIVSYMTLLSVAVITISCNTSQNVSALQEDAKESEIFYEPEQQPYYCHGGGPGLLSDLYSIMLKTAPVTQDCVSGRAVVRFTINKEGLIDHNSIKIIRNKSVPDDYMNAAIEAIKCLDKFEPGKMNGTPKSVTYILPILYPVPTEFIMAE